MFDIIRKWILSSPKGEDGLSDRSVPVFWAGAVAGLLAAVALSINGAFWYALSFLLVSLTLIVSALVHNRTCMRQQKEMTLLRERTREEVLAVQAQAKAAEEQCKADILRYHSAISHGLRIPLSVIIGYAELMLDEQVVNESERSEYLRKICEKVNYISDVLAHILLEFRTEAGVSKIIRKPVELLSLLRGVAEEFGNAAMRGGISIQVNSEYETIEIMGNVTGLTKAFYNIIENSIKYMGRYGSITITVSMLGENEVMVVFKDDGEGLSAEETPRIFELNYQGSNHRIGNGLGLYIVKTEVESHGGTVYAKSERGKGMGIYVTLPAQAAGVQTE